MTPNHNPALRDWFMSLDRWSLLTFLLLLILGSVVSFSISPDIADAPESLALSFGI